MHIVIEKTGIQNGVPHEEHISFTGVISYEVVKGKIIIKYDRVDDDGLPIVEIAEFPPEAGKRIFYRTEERVAGKTVRSRLEVNKATDKPIKRRR